MTVRRVFREGATAQPKAWGGGLTTEGRDRGRRDGLLVKLTGEGGDRSFRGPKFSSLALTLGGSWPPTPPVPRDTIPSSTLCMHLHVYAYTYAHIDAPSTRPLREHRRPRPPLSIFAGPAGEASALLTGRVCIYFPL